jgi:hypothetical protein
VTVTSTVAPAVPAGEVTVTDVDVLDKIVATLAPKFTAVGPARPVPVTVTCWPPIDGPELATAPDTKGKVPYVNRSAGKVLDVTPAAVTVTSTVPAASAGEMTVQVVLDEQLTAVPAVPPKLTVVAPGTNPVPVTVTTVPPPIGPELGATEATPKGRLKL